jgi:hypothetical protein
MGQQCDFAGCERPDGVIYLA